MLNSIPTAMLTITTITIAGVVILNIKWNLNLCSLLMDTLNTLQYYVNKIRTIRTIRVVS